MLSFEFPQPEISSMHGTNNSWDIKMHHHVESSPIVSRLRSKQTAYFSNRTPDTKIMHCSTEPDEICDLEHLRTELIEEKERLRNQEFKVKQFFDNLKEENSTLKLERIELRKSKEILQQREERILDQKLELENVKSSFDKEKEEIKKLKESLNLEYLKLKQEKLKIKTHKKMQERNLLRISEKSNKLEKQIEIFHRERLLTLD